MSKVITVDFDDTLAVTSSTAWGGTALIPIERIVNFVKSKIDSGAISIQPMGSLFEQSLLIIMDHLILLLMDKTGMTENEMFSHHANLE